MPRADARALALLWAALGTAPAAATGAPTAFDVAVADSRAPKTSYVLHLKTRLIDVLDTERTAELIEWRQDGRVRVEAGGGRHLADCASRKGWSAQGSKVVEDRDIWKHLCGITPSPIENSEIEVQGGVTRLAGGARLVVVPDAGFERWIRLDPDNVIMAISYRPYGPGRAAKGWAVADWIERCALPEHIFEPGSLVKSADFRCAAQTRETLADPMLPEGFRLSRWHDEDRFAAIFDDGFGDDDIGERLDAALREVEQAAGPDSIAYAEALTWAGLGWYERDEQQRSIPYFQKALALYERLVPEGHPLRTLSLNTLTDAIATARNWFGAAEAGRRQRAIYQGRLAGNGPDSAVTIVSFMELTQQRIEAGELQPLATGWQETVTELRRGHDLLVRTQVDDWRDVNPLRELLVAMYAEAGQFDQALALIDVAEKSGVMTSDPLDILIDKPGLDEARIDILERAGRTREAAELRAKLTDNDNIHDHDILDDAGLTPTA